MNKINWCKKQKKGIKLIEPNERIGRDYLKESYIDFENIASNSKKWKIIMGYYACYNAFYGLLLKSGIKCEIHDCSIELLTLFEELSKYKVFLEKLKSDRKDAQYYLKEPENIDVNKINSFILECNEIFNKISYDEIHKIREKLK